MGVSFVLWAAGLRQKSPCLPFRAGAGRCGHRPLQITTKNQRISRADRVVRPYKRDTIDRLYHRFSYVEYWPPPRCFRRNCPILQTSGVFVKFIFHAVGVDAYIDPQERAVLWRFSGESVLIPIVHRRGGRPCPPAENPAFLEEFSANSQHFNGRTESSAPTRSMKNRTRPAKNRCVSRFAPWRADVGIGPYERPRKINEFRGRTGSSAPTKGIKNRTRPAKNRCVSRFAPWRADVGIGPYK